MGYLTNLPWLKQFNQHCEAEQKVLLALSNEKYKWRTKDRLLAVTGLDSTTLDTTLADLISRNLVKPSFSKSRKLIFGLVERVY